MSQPAQAANTFLWDVVFVIRASDVNTAITRMGAYPKKLNLVAAAGSNIWVKADIDSWQIIPGGDTQHIAFQLKLKNITFGGTGVPAAGMTVAAVSVTAKFQLAFARLASNSDLHRLVVAPAAAPDPGDPNTWALTVSFDPDELKTLPLNSLQRIALQRALSLWLSGSVNQFQHVFAELDVPDQVATGDFAWLKPTTVDYAYSCNANDPNLDNAVLGVLAMTGGRADDLSEVLVSSFVIPAGERAGCIISKSLYLRDGLLPRIPLLLGGSKASDFAYIDSKGLIQLQNTVSMAPVKSDDGTDSPCDLVKLELDVVGNEVRLRTQVRVLVRNKDNVVIAGGPKAGPGRVYPGTKNICYALAEQTAFYTLVPGALVNGKQSISFQQGSTPGSETKWTEPPPDDPTSSTIQSILMWTTVVSAAVSALSGNFVLSAAYGLMLAATQTAQKIAGDETQLANFKLAPYLDANTIRDAMTLRWCGGQTYELTSVALNNGLQFGGKVHF